MFEYLQHAFCSTQYFEPFVILCFLTNIHPLYHWSYRSIYHSECPQMTLIQYLASGNCETNPFLVSTSSSSFEVVVRRSERPVLRMPPSFPDMMSLLSSRSATVVAWCGSTKGCLSHTLRVLSSKCIGFYHFLWEPVSCILPFSIRTIFCISCSQRRIYAY